jgi:hypothetical protein
MGPLQAEAEAAAPRLAEVGPPVAGRVVRNVSVEPGGGPRRLIWGGARACAPSVPSERARAGGRVDQLPQLVERRQNRGGRGAPGRRVASVGPRSSWKSRPLSGYRGERARPPGGRAAAREARGVGQRVGGADTGGKGGSPGPGGRGLGACRPPGGSGGVAHDGIEPSQGSPDRAAHASKGQGGRGDGGRGGGGEGGGPRPHVGGTTGPHAGSNSVKRKFWPHDALDRPSRAVCGPPRLNRGASARGEGGRASGLYSRGIRRRRPRDLSGLSQTKPETAPTARISEKRRPSRGRVPMLRSGVVGGPPQGGAGPRHHPATSQRGSLCGRTGAPERPDPQI